MNRIKELRIEKGLTQNQLASLLGINQTAAGKYERGELEPNLQNLIKLSHIFECSVDYIICNADDFGNITIHTEKPAPLPQDEQTLLNNFRKLPQDLRHRAAVYMQNLADAAEEESFNFHGGKNYGNKTKTL